MGGVETRFALAAQPPQDLRASVLIVQHRSAEPPGLLGKILSHSGRLHPVVAEDRMALEHRRIYVAPADGTCSSRRKTVRRPLLLPWAVTQKTTDRRDVTAVTGTE